MNIIEESKKAFARIDLQYDQDWLYQHHYIIALTKQYDDNIYKDIRILIDLLCLQQMKEVAFSILEDWAYEIRTTMYDYLEVIQELDIDFNLFVLLAGEEYINSDNYTYSGEDCTENQVEVLLFLIEQNYSTIVGKLTTHYGDRQKLLFSLVASLSPSFEDTVLSIETLEDVFDYPEVAKTFEWGTSGFDIHGDQ